jgi:hypothetical protein
MPGSDGERGVERGGRERDARGRTVLVNPPPKFIHRRHLAVASSASTTRGFQKPGHQARREGDPFRHGRAHASQVGGAFASSSASSLKVHVDAHVRLDFYIQALLPSGSLEAQKKMLHSAPLKHPNIGSGTPGVGFACLRSGTEKGDGMKTPAIHSLNSLSLDEALLYVDASRGDELDAAYLLARDRNRFDGSSAEPDEMEVHHALFLLRRARGLEAPSFDSMRVQLRLRQRAA